MVNRTDIFKVLYLLLGILAAGVIGYHLIEGWPLLDSFYMTVITISTVGFGEVHPLSDTGKIFSIFLIVTGVGVAFYAFTTSIQYYLGNHFQNIWGRRKMREQIARLTGHFVLCGYGSVGNSVVETCRREEIPFVVIDKDEKAIERACSRGCLCIEGDATDYNTLKKAGISKAKGAIVATGEDATNVFIIVTVRKLAPELFIISRASSEDSVSKLEAVGANRVINPYHSAGQRMARLALYPLVTDFIETVLEGYGEDLALEDMEIEKESSLVGKSIEDAQRESNGASILAIRKRGSETIPKPSDNTRIETGDRIVILGTREQLRLLEKT